MTQVLTMLSSAAFHVSFSDHLALQTECVSALRTPVPTSGLMTLMHKIDRKAIGPAALLLWWMTYVQVICCTPRFDGLVIAETLDALISDEPL